MKKHHFFALFLLISSLCTAQLPRYSVTINDSLAPPGYYFLSVHASDTTWIAILDNKGNTVYYKWLAHTATNSNFELQPNGSMSFDDGNKFYMMDSTFRVVDSVACKNNCSTDLHDLLVLPNGHFLLLGFEFVTMDLSRYRWKDGSGSDTAKVRCGIIQEQDAKKNVVFEWHGKDHFAFEDLDTFYLRFDKVNVDYNHFNSLATDRDGNLLLSSRNFNEITKINRKTGEVMWRMGGKNNQFKFLNCPEPFYGQHDVRRIANGNITLFDGGNHNIHHGARVMEFKLDEVNKTAELKWSYTYDSSMYSIARGGNVQRLGGTKTLVNYGDVVHSDLCYLVIDSNGQENFELKFTDHLGSYRVLNYPKLPFKLHRPQITCFDSAGIAYLAAGRGFRSYNWSNGSNTRTIPITEPGTYSVFVPYGSGFISSEKLIVSDIHHACKKPAQTPMINGFRNAKKHSQTRLDGHY